MSEYKHILTDFKDLRKVIGEITKNQPAKSRYQQQAEKMKYSAEAEPKDDKDGEDNKNPDHAGEEEIKKAYLALGKSAQGSIEFQRGLVQKELAKMGYKTYSKQAFSDLFGIESNDLDEVTGKEIAAKMMKDKSMKAFASKVAKMKTVSRDDLHKILPDYVAGAAITKLFEGVVVLDKKTGKAIAYYDSPQMAKKFEPGQKYVKITDKEFMATYKPRKGGFYGRTGRPKGKKESIKGLWNETIDEESKYVKVARDVVKKKSAKKVDGVLLDLYTAGVIVQIYDAVNSKYKKRMDGLKLKQLSDLAFRAIFLGRPSKIGVAFKDMQKEEVDLDEKLKYEGKFKKGDTIKSFDFQPRTQGPRGKKDHYIIGKITGTEMRQGAKVYVIKVINDSGKTSGGRVGDTGYVPMGTSMDWDGRIVKEEVDLDEVLKPGAKVKVPHKGKMVQGKVVRYDKGGRHGSPFYVVDVGEYESPKIPAHKIKVDAWFLPDEVDLDEGRMKELHGYIEQGKSAEWIAKKMKVDLKTIKALMSEEFIPSRSKQVKEEHEHAKQSPFKLKSQQYPRAIPIKTDGFGNRHATVEDIISACDSFGMIIDKELQVEQVQKELGKKGFISFKQTDLDNVFDDRETVRMILALESDIEKQTLIEYTRTEIQYALDEGHEIEFLKPDGTKSIGPVLKLSGNTFNVKDKYTGKSFTYKYSKIEEKEVKTFSEVSKERGPKQLTNPNKEVMVVKKNKVIVIDKKDKDKYLKQGWSLAEETNLDEVSKYLKYSDLLLKKAKLVAQGPIASKEVAAVNKKIAKEMKKLGITEETNLDEWISKSSTRRRVKEGDKRKSAKFEEWEDAAEATGDKEAYQKFFDKVLKKFGVSSPAELDGEKKKEFFNYIDKNWKADHEEVDVHKSYKVDGRRANFREKMKKLGYIKSRF